MHARRVARQDDTEGLGARVVADRVPFVLAMAAVEDGEVETAGEAAQNRRHLCQDVGDLPHVPPHEHVRHPRRRGELPDVVIRRLRLVADRERLPLEEVSRARAQREQLPDRDGRQRAPRRVLRRRSQISPNQAGVRLADLDERLASPMMRDAHEIEAAVWNAVTKDGQVEHGDSCGARRSALGPPGSGVLLRDEENYSCLQSIA